MSSEKTFFKNVYEEIKRKILTMEYMPGDPLTEQKLCSMLHVSRTPVRTALKILEKEGLVTYIPNKGAFVRTLSPNDINEVYVLRAVLEGYCAKKACEVVTNEIIDHLNEILDKSRKALDEGRFTEASIIATEMHKVIIDLANNTRIKKILFDIGQDIGRVQHLSEGVFEKLVQSDAEHRDILNAIKERDGGKAEMLMREHIHGVERDAAFEYYAKARE